MLYLYLFGLILNLISVFRFIGSGYNVLYTPFISYFVIYLLPDVYKRQYEGRAKENKDILDNVVTTEFLRQEDKKTNSECRTCCCTAGSVSYTHLEVMNKYFLKGRILP